MDPKLYKTTVSQRGYTYSHYAVPPHILFLHGFPNYSGYWKNQAAHFSNNGYGVIIPDFLGYGATDKPNDPAEYMMFSMVKDVADILDAERVAQVVVVAHDWGCGIASRLANIHPERVLAVAFLAVSYMPPSPQFSYDGLVTVLKSVFDSDVYGYWEWFSSDGAVALIEQHMDSFQSLGLTLRPEEWTTHITPTGKYAEWCKQDRMTETLECFSKEPSQMWNDMTGPLNWYKVQVRQLNNEDDASIPLEQYTLSMPIFFGAALDDRVCPLAMGMAPIVHFVPEHQRTAKEFKAGHQLHWEKAAQVNQALEEWIVRSY